MQLTQSMEFSNTKLVVYWAYAWPVICQQSASYRDVMQWTEDFH